MKEHTLMAEYKGDRVGQQLGPYRLTRLLGAGGFGEVYEANHQLLQQTRAIKLLLERHFHAPNQRERFLREARTLATLEHPNILPVLEVGEEGNVLYLVMPFYRRGTLNDFLKQRTTLLPLAEVERLLAQMCAAVGYAHARNIAHLDLKPENMLIHEDGRLVLSDFGLAHLIKQGRLEAGSSASWGTPYYMAPEQIRGEPELRSDVYALGIILYQLLTNQRPFAGPTPEAVMMKHLLEPPPSLRAVSPTAPAMLEPVIQKVLGKKPEDRYTTAEALLADFLAAMNGPSSRSAQPPAPSVSPAAPTPQVNISMPVVQPTIPVLPGRTPHPAESVTIMKATAAGCEIELKDGRYCGIPPIGRCATCGRAFCPTHQAWFYGQFSYPYVDQCAPCFAKTPAEMARAKSEKDVAERRAAEEYFMSGAARTAFLTAGVPPVKIYSVKRRSKQGFFGYKEVEDATPFIHKYGSKTTEVQHAWILGEFRLQYGIPKSPSHSYEDDYEGVTGRCLTALLDLSPAFLGMWIVPDPLVPVRPWSRGYECLNGSFYGWIEAVQAVKRLTGESS